MWLSNNRRVIRIFHFNSRSMKIYTKGGDKGKTSLFTGDRVTKTHRIFDTLGAVDELNANIGVVSLSSSIAFRIANRAYSVPMCVI